MALFQPSLPFFKKKGRRGEGKGISRFFFLGGERGKGGGKCIGVEDLYNLVCRFLMFSCKGGGGRGKANEEVPSELSSNITFPILSNLKGFGVKVSSVSATRSQKREGVADRVLWVSLLSPFLPKKKEEGGGGNPNDVPIPVHHRRPKKEKKEGGRFARRPHAEKKKKKKEKRPGRAVVGAPSWRGGGAAVAIQGGGWPVGPRAAFKRGRGKETANPPVLRTFKGRKKILYKTRKNSPSSRGRPTPGRTKKGREKEKRPYPTAHQFRAGCQKKKIP